MVMAITEPARHLDTRGERRADTRARGPFDGAWNGASGRQAIRISDISEGGCFVESLATLPPGDRVVLTIGLPASGTVEVSGEVVTMEPGIGGMS